MAGYTRFLVGNINTRLAMVPLDVVVNKRNIFILFATILVLCVAGLSAAAVSSNSAAGMDGILP